MSLETELTTVLSGICPRVFPDVAPYGTQQPYITWQQIGGPALTYVEGALPDKRGALIQINVWDDRRIDANAMALQIEAALVAATSMQAQARSAFSASFDDADLARGTMQDFEIWAAR
jgi:hypothetical protein